MNPAAAPLAASYDPSLVVVSILIAALAAYVTLDLVRRGSTPDRGVAGRWWLGGSLALGSGIWAMHFVGMLAFSLPIVIGYTRLLTFASWLAAVGVSGIALAVSGRRRLGPASLAGGAVAMGGGVCAMHYIGMAAIDLAPGIEWDLAWVAASVLLAVLASAAALKILFWLRTAALPPGPLQRGVAALAIGAAASGMHYLGMAAASFPAGAVCLSAGSLSGSGLGAWVGMASLLLLAMALWTSVLDAGSQRRAARLAGSLQEANARLEAANAELHKRAFLDPLTGLANRLLFEDRLAHAVARHARSEERIAARPVTGLAVLFIDLDGFKSINDSLGHAAGDAVLVETALRLRSVARETDTVARVGGDEFLLLMEDVGSLADCITLARRLVRALAEPFERAGPPVQVSASVGIVMHPGHGHHGKLIASAEAAKSAAKRAGGNTYVVFDSQMDAGATEQSGLQHDLRRALELGQLSLHYQPKIDGRRGQISGVEALLRWTHPTRGPVGPNEFIPVAERFGLIGAIGAWVIDEACRQMRAWAADGVRMRVAINISVHQLREDDLVDRIRLALERNRIEPSQLLCEITESVAMEDLKATQRAFEGLAQLGVYLSIDDFGTGYSSLSYLRQLPARQLKIDRSFINDLETSHDARAVVDAVVRLAHALGLKVVAEGVETDGQRLALLELGCDELQGFFFARPMSAGTLLDWAQGVKPVDTVDFTPSVLLDQL